MIDRAGLSLPMISRSPKPATPWRTRLKTACVAGSSSKVTSADAEATAALPRSHILLDAETPLLRSAAAMPCEALRRRGFVVVKLPPEIVAASRKCTALMLKFFALSNQEKNQYRTRQDGETVLSHPGYLTPSPGWAELFEIRRSQRDASYKFPPRLEAPCMRLFEMLRDLSLRWLSLLSLHCCADPHALTRLAATDSAPSTLRAIHYDQVVELGRQLDAIPPGDATSRADAERTVMAGFPAHVDSSLLTLAPRGSCSGLSVRDYADGRWLRIERSMAEDEAVLFCGDPIAFITRHYFPACMHRPDGLEMARQAPRTRISTPFFLYPDNEAVLDATACRADLAPGTLTASESALPPSTSASSSALVQASSLPPPQLNVGDFRLNVGDCRERWPWKKLPYYGGRVICRDSDHFPGLDQEVYPMDYAD